MSPIRTACVILAACTPAIAQPASFEVLSGGSPCNVNYASGYKLSRNGSVVVCGLTKYTGTVASSLVTPGGAPGAARGVSDDGQTVVGFSGASALRWPAFTGGDVYSVLPALPGGRFAKATAISGDGVRIYGVSEAPDATSPTGYAAFAVVWNGNVQPEMLGLASEAKGATPMCANLTGAVVGGNIPGPNSRVIPAFWTEAEGWTALGVSDPTLSGEVVALSDDGLIMLRNLTNGDFVSSPPFNAPLCGLASGMAANGLLAAGVACDMGGSSSGAVWPSPTGMPQNLSVYVIAHGVNTLGYVLGDSTCSKDGRTFVGEAHNIGGGSNVLYRASIARKCGASDVAGFGSQPGYDGRLTVDDLVFFLAEFFASNAQVADIVGFGGAAGADGIVTVDDLVAMLSGFFAGCP